MIDEKKLLCTFIFSAYESGFCGLMLSKEEREAHKELYTAYVKNGTYYPQTEISNTQKKMMDEVANSSIRDYIYNGHFQVVQTRIEDMAQKSLAEIKESKPLLVAAKLCPINIYEVLSTNNESLVGRNIYSNKQLALKILEGLETPTVGDLVSGHWNYFLEIITDWEGLGNHKMISSKYYKSLE